MNKINVIIVHGSNSSEKDARGGKPENERHWMPWITNILKKKGINVSNKLYPFDWKPDYLTWKKEFDKNYIDENSILIGHSAGCGFLVRWLTESKKKVSKLILVAPAVIKSSKWKSINNLLDFELNNEILNFTDNIFIFVSNNDSKEILKSVDKLSKLWHIKPIELKNHGHFTLLDMGTEKFPELLSKILE